MKNEGVWGGIKKSQKGMEKVKSCCCIKIWVKCLKIAS